MDDYLERLIQKERDRNQHANQEFFENNQALKNMRELEEEQINDLIKEEQWQKDLEDLKQMNQVDIKEYVIHEEALQLHTTPDNHAELVVNEDTESNPSPVKAKQRGMPVFELAEDRLMREIKAQEDDKKKHRKNDLTKKS